MDESVTNAVSLVKKSICKDFARIFYRVFFVWMGDIFEESHIIWITKFFQSKTRLRFLRILKRLIGRLKENLETFSTA